MTELEILILETLSFYDPIINEHLILQMDDAKVQAMRELTREDLERTLIALEKKKLIKKAMVGPDQGWIKIFPKKSLWRRIRSLLPF